MASAVRVRGLRSCLPCCGGPPGSLRCSEAEFHPPHGELAQAAERRGGERRAVVRTTGVRPAIRPEQAREDGACVHWWSRESCGAAAENAALGLSHRQGGAVAASAGANRAVDVRRPDGMGGRCRARQGRIGRGPPCG